MRISSTASFAALIAAVLVAVLAVFAATPAHADMLTSCAFTRVQIDDSDGNSLYARDSFSDTPVYSETLAQAATSSVVVSLTFEDTAVASGTIKYSRNGTQIGALANAPHPAPRTITGLSTQCNQMNQLIIQSKMEYDAEYQYSSCNYMYVFKLYNPACVVGDPQFAGLRGQSYQVHGIDGAVYSLISAPDYLINSRFQFLEGPRPCPVMPTTGRKSVACWSHSGSYLGSVGLLTSSGQAIELQSGAADAGFAAVRINGRELAVNEVVELTSASGAVIGAMIRNSTHEVTINVGVFGIELENNDFFVNLRAVRVSPRDWRVLAHQQVHGLLGQTWQARRYAGAVREIEGEVDDYVIGEDSLHGYEFVYNRFNGVVQSA